MAVCIGSELPPKLKDILPPGYEHHLCSMEEEEAQGTDSSNILCRIRLHTKNKEEAKKWIEDFGETSMTTWRVSQNYTRTGTKVVFKIKYRCQHNTRPEHPHTNQNRVRPSKNTDCAAQMMVTVKNTITAKGKPCKHKVDTHMPEFPTVINLTFKHNHNLHCADALKFKDVSKVTEDKLIALFYKKYGPADALEVLKYDLHEEHGEEYYLKAADRSVVPDVQFCIRLYYKIFKANYGESKGEAMFLSLQEIASQYNTSNQTEAMKVEMTDDQLIVAICTPLMQRVHTLHQQAGELCFMDASSNMDRHGCKVFLIMTHSCVGGLPVGVLITSSETESIIKAALELYRSILPAGCFGGSGLAGPKVFITDDCKAERNALNRVFPNSVLVLCIFHVLQAAWRWLWSQSNNVPKEQRPNHFMHMKRMVYAKSREEIDSFFKATLQDTTLHKSFKAYLKMQYERKAEWALAYRDDLPVRGNFTNNYCEAAFRVLKDRILERTKAFNIPQLADFVSTRLQDYYQRRILDIASGRLYNVLTSRTMLRDRTIPKSDVKQVTETEHVVRSQSQSDIEYQVDSHIGHCTCERGKTGGPCKHQAAVVRHYHTSNLNFVPVTDQDVKHHLFMIATGNGACSKDFFASLSCATNSATVKNNNEAQVLPPDVEMETEVDGLQSEVIIDHQQQSSSKTHDIQAVKSQFKMMADEVMDKLERYPDVFEPAVQAMLHQYGKIKTDSLLVSALHTFGKQSGAAAVLQKRGKKALNRLQMRSSVHIGVQPTAIPRRKKKPQMGRGGKISARGRPSAAGASSVLPVSVRRKVAPHSLSKSVSQNKTLGKTHSIK